MVYRVTDDFMILFLVRRNKGHELMPDMLRRRPYLVGRKQCNQAWNKQKIMKPNLKI